MPGSPGRARPSKLHGLLVELPADQECPVRRDNEVSGELCTRRRLPADQECPVRRDSWPTYVRRSSASSGSRMPGSPGPKSEGSLRQLVRSFSGSRMPGSPGRGFRPQLVVLKAMTFNGIKNARFAGTNGQGRSTGTNAFNGSRMPGAPGPPEWSDRRVRQAPSRGSRVPGAPGPDRAAKYPGCLPINQECPVRRDGGQLFR